MSRANIFLIGYMASGKTTFGRALAYDSRRRFIDLDEYVEESCGCSISDIFSRYGESEFRRLERESLRELTGKVTDAVIACGGGTPCHGDNMRLMNKAGLTVWLDAPVETLLRRLRLERSKRPLVASLDDGEQLSQYVKSNLELRTPYYSLAGIRFDSSRLESEDEIAQTIEMFKSICPIEL